jgi:hypothetical protein
MRRPLSPALLALLLLLCGCAALAAAQKPAYGAVLRGKNQNPPVTTKATGFFKLKFSSAKKPPRTATWTLSLARFT